MNNCVEWIIDLLECAKDSNSNDVKCLLEKCGEKCALRKNHVRGMKQLKQLAVSCKTRADYVEFLNNHIPAPAKFVEEKDGIVLHLGKKQCDCPMYPEVSNPELCNCTNGSNIATWSEFFGKPVKIDIIESHLRGGKDCVLKIYI